MRRESAPQLPSAGVLLSPEIVESASSSQELDLLNPQELNAEELQLASTFLQFLFECEQRFSATQASPSKNDN